MLRLFRFRVRFRGIRLPRFVVLRLPRFVILRLPRFVILRLDRRICRTPRDVRLRTE
jgi:hypothetical protein